MSGRDELEIDRLPREDPAASPRRWLDPALDSDSVSEEHDGAPSGASPTGDSKEWLLLSDESAEEVAAEAHDELLRSVLGRVPSRARHVRERLDAPTEHPEQPSLGWSATAQQPQVQVEDFLDTFSARDVHHEELKRHLERLARLRTEKRLEPPPHRLAAARAKQQASYCAMTTELKAWQPAVHRLESKTHLSFPLPDASGHEGAAELGAANDLEWMHQSLCKTPRPGLEQTVRDLLAAQEALDEQQIMAAEARSVQHLTLAEIERRRDELARNRALVFYKEQRAKRQKRTKSQRSRGLQKRRRERSRELYTRDLEAIVAAAAPRQGAASDHDAEQVAAARRELEALGRERERQRALERATQRHRQRSRWVRHQLRRGVEKLDASTREAVQEQRRLGEAALCRPSVQLVTKEDGLELERTKPLDSPVLHSEVKGSDSNGHSVVPARSKSKSGQRQWDLTGSAISNLAFMRRATEGSEARDADQSQVPIDDWIQARRRFRGCPEEAEWVEADAPSSDEGIDRDSDDCTRSASSNSDERSACGIRTSPYDRGSWPSKNMFERSNQVPGEETPKHVSNKRPLGQRFHGTFTDDLPRPVLQSTGTAQDIDASRAMPQVPPNSVPVSRNVQSKGERANAAALPPVDEQDTETAQDGSDHRTDHRSKASESQLRVAGYTTKRKGASLDRDRTNPWLHMATAIATGAGDAVEAPPPPMHPTANEHAPSRATKPSNKTLKLADTIGPEADTFSTVSGQTLREGTPRHSADRSPPPPSRTEHPHAGVDDQPPTGMTFSETFMSEQPNSGQESVAKTTTEQEQWIRMAFEGSGVATAEDEAEFARHKSKQLDAEVDELEDTSVIPVVLPGWGFWSGAGLESAYERRLKQQQQEAAERVRAMAQARRRDRQSRHVILSERRVARAADILQVRRVPAPFQTAAQFEAATVGNIPLGPEWVTARTHEQLVRPLVQTRRGVPIAPLRRHQAP